MIELKLPNLDVNADDSAKIKMIQSYLYQLVRELNYVLRQTSGLGSVNSDTITEDTLNTFNSIKEMLIKSTDIVREYTALIKRQLEGTYVEKAELDSHIELESNNINLLKKTTATQGIEMNSALVNAGLASALPNVPVPGSGFYMKMGDDNVNTYLLCMGSGALYTGTQTGTGTITWTEK